MLDGAVLVVSAVEGVQSQTRVLMRALQRLSIPTLIFVNKIDRAGADDERVLRAISERLTSSIAAMGSSREPGTSAADFEAFDADDPAFLARLAELLGERDDEVMAAYIESSIEDATSAGCVGRTNEACARASGLLRRGSYRRRRRAAAERNRDAAPTLCRRPRRPGLRNVFKIERGARGEKFAYVRLFAGTIFHPRPVAVRRRPEDKVTAIAVFERGPAVQRPRVSAGAVAKLWGLTGARIGDAVGEPARDGAVAQFPPPTLESVVDRRTIRRRPSGCERRSRSSRSRTH